MTKVTLPRHIKGGAKNTKGHKLIGISLALIGFFWFAKKVGWIPVAAGGSAIFWPAVLFLFGVFILVGTGHRRKKHTD
jgi:hypothetical protein